MKCSDKKIAELLPWYVNKSLSKDDEGRVMKHLEECPACTKELEDLMRFRDEIAQYPDELFTDHVYPEELVVYAEARRELSREDLARIETHLESCSACREELQMLQQVNSSLEAPSTSSLFDRIAESAARLVQGLFARPALAYIAVLLLLFPAYLGIFKGRQSSDPTLAHINYDLTQSDMRSAEGLDNEIHVKSSDELFSLSFTVPILADDQIRYDAVILDDQKTPVWSREGVQSLDEYGTFLLMCPAEFFDEGEYLLVINEIDVPEKKVQQEYLFPFSVKME